MQMKLSVVIVNYKVPVFLHQCLNSLEVATENIDTEFFVVDNASNDNSVEFLRQYHPEVIYIENQENVGFSKANNMAIKRAKGEFLLLINPDTIISEDTIQRCVDFMSDNSEAGAIGVKQNYAYGMFAPESRRAVPKPVTAFYKFVGLCKRFPKHRKFGRYYLGFLDKNKTEEIEILSGAFMFIRHEAIKKVGAFDEDFFMYGEDIDLSYRILKGGFKNYYIPTNIIHYKGESTHKRSFTYVNNFNRSMAIFFRKHFKAYSWFLEIPILAAVYIKTLWGMIKVSVLKLFMNKITDDQIIKSYKFLLITQQPDSSPALKLLNNNGYSPVVVEADNNIIDNGHAVINRNVDDFDFVVYDTEEFSYKQMIQAFVSQFEKNGKKKPSLAVYHHDINKIVTYSYILQENNDAIESGNADNEKENQRTT